MMTTMTAVAMLSARVNGRGSYRHLLQIQMTTGREIHDDDGEEGTDQVSRYISYCIISTLFNRPISFFRTSSRADSTAWCILLFTALFP
jgi:hypothetical protein